MIESGPIPAAHGVVRWRLIDLAQWVFDEFAIAISKQTLSRELRALGFRKLSARPRHHAQDGEAVAAFKKTFSPAWTRSPRAGAGTEQADRDLVPGRGPHRPEEQDHPALGAARHPAAAPTISAPVRPISSAPSVRPAAPRRGWSCHAATSPRWRCI